jgi:pectin methylesterase-like acyl-CoA thioesterase
MGLALKKLSIILVAAALLTGCAATPTPTAETTTKAATPSQSALTMDQITALNDGLRKISPSAVEGSADKAKAVCAQIADGAHGEGFVRGVALRFDLDASQGQAILDAIASAKVC